MKLDENLTDVLLYVAGQEHPDLKKAMQVLIDHFNYSVQEIYDYDQLTTKEKKLVEEEFFNTMV
ncbi:MAG: hypothetical protein Nk1A_8420 [Endomicrobiia bacterium]|nr:MAG: hypothetical protein Nk1A_8420 [Endomicrobiia bacterium]